MPEQITLYTAKVCPYAHRVELALAEVGADAVKYQIDLQNKPEWYAPKVNPASKVPAIAYGGPQVPPDQPSPESTKIAESLVLLEFAADLFPNSTLLPSDPVARAKVRFFIDAVSTKFTPAWYGFAMRGEPADKVLQGVEEVQKLLPENAKFAVGDEFTIADAAIAPFLGRAETSLAKDLGLFKEGEGPKILETLKGEKFRKFWSYYESLKARPSFKSTYDEEYIAEYFAKRFGRATKQAS